MRYPGEQDRLPPPVDQHLVVPESEAREQMIRGRIVCLPANPPHADRQSRLDYLLSAHARPGYVVSTELLTRFTAESDFSTDVCIRKAGDDPATGRRYLEEVAFEVVSTQKPGDVTAKAEDMAARGVRRIFAVFVKRGEVAEWRGEWRPIVGQIEDETLVRALPVRAILDAAEADNAVARALQAKGNPVIAEIRNQGFAEGQRQALRQAVRDLCDLLAIPLSPEREAYLGGLDLAALQVLWSQLKQKRAWPG
jgi:hypothetical protein